MKSKRSPGIQKNFPTHPFQKPEIRRRFYAAGAFLLALFLAVGIAGLFYDQEIQSLTAWASQKLGFVGLAAILLVSDTIVSPLPPDLLLLIVAKGPLREHWPLYVGILGCVSTLAGNIAWVLARWVADHRWAAPLLRAIPQEHVDRVRKWGPLAVVLGAATPVPFSITCWIAGLFKIPWKSFFLASLARLPRFYLYYLAIHWSDVMKQLF